MSKPGHENTKTRIGDKNSRKGDQELEEENLENGEEVYNLPQSTRKEEEFSINNNRGSRQASPSKPRSGRASGQ